MAENVADFELDFNIEYDRDKENAAPGRKWLGFQGPVLVKVTGVEVGVSGSNNKTLTIGLEGLDEDALGWQGEAWRLPVTGKDKNGKANITQLVRYLDSIYTFAMDDEDKAKAAVQKLLGQRKSSSTIIKNLIGKKLAVWVSVRSYERDDGLKAYASKVSRPLLRAAYEKAKEQGGAAWRKPVPPAAAAWYEELRASASSDGGDGGDEAPASGNGAATRGAAPKGGASSEAGASGQELFGDF
jgi:hypothetical protein